MAPLDPNPEGMPAEPKGRAASSRRRILIEQLEFEANVGVYPHEHGRLQRLQFWLMLDIVDAYDGRSDRLRDVYDYDSAIAIVHRITTGRHFNLLERLAEDIASTCLADPRVTAVSLRIAKPDAVPGCRSVGIEIERRR
jgi:dihydroneopterin aldolase